ncbi:MAG: TrkH family potassium uptake protein [Bacillota bacterium]
MRNNRIFFLIGIMLIFLALTMLLPTIWAFVEQGRDQTAFLKSIMLCLALGGLLYWFFLPARGEELNIVENFTMVTLAWFIAGIFGALPYHFYGVFDGSFLQAFFESVSGFTTTGATLIEDVEVLPRGILLWRSLTQWLGGMGIIVLFLAVLPRFGFRSMTMFKAELPGPIAERVVPRVVETARRLWLIYVALTVIQILLLIISGLGIYDSIAHAFTTMPTGGFSTYNASIAAFNNPYAEIIIIVFMLFAGINFALYFRLIRGDLSIFKNPELRFFLIVILAGIILVSINTHSHSSLKLSQILRESAFQVVSITTTTGYATADFELWPSFSRAFLLFMMFLGACGGSTGGSMKQVRWMMMIKYSFRELRQTIHPSARASVKLGDHTVSEEVLRPIMGFGFTYLALTGLATLAIAFMGLDFETAFSSVAATIGNVGPGLSGVGPTETYGIIPPAGLFLLTIMMVVGRLEVFTVLVILLPESRQLWARRLNKRG